MSRHYRQKEFHAGGISAITVLGLIFLVLKLTGEEVVMMEVALCILGIFVFVVALGVLPVATKSANTDRSRAVSSALLFCLDC